MANHTSNNASYLYYITQIKQESTAAAPGSSVQPPLSFNTTASDPCNTETYNIQVLNSENKQQVLCGFVAKIKACLSVPFSIMESDKGDIESKVTVSGKIQDMVNNHPKFTGSSTTDVCDAKWEQGSSDSKGVIAITLKSVNLN
jgi:hypothetical protein